MGARIATEQSKIDWLLAHQGMWEGWPRGENGNDTRRYTIVAAMKDAGLISMKTYAPDVALTNLIVEARRQRREGAAHG